MINIITKQLKSAFKDADIEIKGYSNNVNNNKFDLRISSSKFRGRNKVQQHQLVYKELHNFLKTGEIHAISLTTLEK